MDRPRPQWIKATVLMFQMSTLSHSGVPQNTPASAARFAAALGGASFWSLPVSSLDRIIWLLKVRCRALLEFSSEDSPPCVFLLAAVG